MTDRLALQDDARAPSTLVRSESLTFISLVEKKMIDLHAIAVVFSVYVIGVIIRGPNFVVIAHQAAHSRTGLALAVVGGVVLVNLFWASAAILGVGVVFAVFPWIALAVKVLGASYLIWFGWRLLLKAGATDLPFLGRTPTDARTAFRGGVATNIVNPKSIAYFGAVFSAAAPPHVNVPTFLGMLAVVAIVASLWYGLVAVVFSRDAVASRYRRCKAWMDRVCGSVIVCIGARQVWGLLPR